MEFEVNGFTYRAGKLNAFQQFDIARRLAPLMSEITGSIQDLAGPELHAEVIRVVALALSKMSDADCHYILSLCLSVVTRKVNDAWAAIYLASAGRFMFEDIQMPEMLAITMKVIETNLSGFFDGRP